MTSFDLTPLFRSTVGFDPLMRLVDSLCQCEDNSGSFPPYNIEKTCPQTYAITMAVAGFSEEDLEILLQNNQLVIKGKARQEDKKTQYLHRGIAGRSFERRFQLADFMKIGEAKLSNGLLQIQLERELPESMKPRTIPIQKGDGDSRPLIEQHAKIR